MYLWGAPTALRAKLEAIRGPMEGSSELHHDRTTSLRDAKFSRSQQNKGAWPGCCHNTKSLFRSIFYLKKRDLQKSDQIFQNIWFQNYEKSNQNTYFYQRPISYPLQWIQKGDLLGDCAASTKGELALGKNLLVAYMPWEGFNFEDAVLINNKVLSTYTSLHIEKYDLEISETSLEKITNHIPGIPKKNLLKLDKNGIVQIGSWVQEGDVLVGKIFHRLAIPAETQTLLTHEKLLYDIVGQKDIQIQERCLKVPQGSSGRIIRITYTYLKKSQNRKNLLLQREALNQPLSESSLTKFKTKIQTGPKLALGKISVRKQTFLINKLIPLAQHQGCPLFCCNGAVWSTGWQASKFGDKLNIYISSYIRKNKKFVTVVDRWLRLYNSFVTKNNYLFIGIKHFYKTQSNIQISSSTRLDQKAKINIDLFKLFNQNRIFNKRFCFDGSIKPSIQANLQLVNKNFSSSTQPQWGKPEASGAKTSCQPLRLPRKGPSLRGRLPESKEGGSRITGRSVGLSRYKNFISIKQRNFQKVVFEKPNSLIQTPKIIPPTLLNCQQSFQKNQNQLRQQSQTKLLKTKRRKFKNIWNYRSPLRHPPQQTSRLKWPRYSNAPIGTTELKSIVRSKTNQLQQNSMGQSLPLNGFKKITIYIAEKREFQVGDKISGRHGNKGIISQIFSNYDMPYLASGDTLDVLLNPLGVPSRMNVGQILECLLGFTGQIFHTKFQILCFDEIYGYEASRSFIYSKIFELCQKSRQKWLFSKKTPGKLNIFDGRNGQLFHQSIMVGSTYLMKLIHIVDEKIHARGTGPYSLITQQPLRGRAKHGGQRFGEMEVWALQGFGSAYTLQELLTVKSDDLQGRNQIMQTLLKNTPLRFGTPESLRVVLRELQCLCLDLQLWDANPSSFFSRTGEKSNKN